ncbi:LacI family DNA-binding transcriptional regulator [Agromyces albus]|uniref:LacI family transcriptional regulator n=1 Tax=Agromyces albus TaxID=205332 RepID=A0A4Q2KVS8_9MICO|nr:LacI family DNA-binding transcriptional regulator [Agromyces albus]RXZ68640.1 LacI family transcriptional regulator [Agromyces albus]
MVTVKSIAAAVGVSPSVVSAVLRGSRHVRMSDATRAKILEAIEEMGYTANFAARSLRTSRSGVLAVVAPKLSNPVFAPMLDGIHDAAEENGYAIMLAEAMRLVDGSRALERILGQGQVDGTILRPSSDVDSEGVRSVFKREAPILVLDEVPDAGQPWLAIDDVAAGRVAAEHLLELGHTRIGFLGGWFSAHQGFRPPAGFRHAGQRRLEGYREALQAAGIEPRPDDVIESDYAAHAGRVAVARIMELRDRPTAFVVNNATTSLGVVGGAIEAGLRVPEDLAIVAIHDIDVLEDVNPSITAVRMPMYELGHRGVTLVAHAIEGEEILSGIITSPPPELIRRRTT